MWPFVFGTILGSVGTLVYEAYYGAKKIKVKLPDGRSYYAMEHLSGESLREGWRRLG